MKLNLTLILVIITVKVYAQSPQQKQNSFIKSIHKSQVSLFIDSLKLKIVDSATRFKRSDLIHSAGITVNTKGSSLLYIVDKKYAYKLDIVSLINASEFVEEYLRPSIIQEISIIEPPFSGALYGALGSLGVVLIEIKKEIRYNLRVAGLILNGKKGNNFQQKKVDEVTIRY